MLIGILIGSALTATAIAALRLLRHVPARTRHWVGAITVAVWVAGAGAKIHIDRTNADSTDEFLEAARSVDWSEPPTRGAGTDAGIQADSVASLVGGLEAKLAAQPDDAKGWALLAQSYANLGEIDEAEKAIARAVALGVDEQALRDRVRLATRDTHSVNWIEEAIGG